MPRFAGGGRYRPKKIGEEQLQREIAEMEQQVATRDAGGMKARKGFQATLLKTLEESDYNAAFLEQGDYTTFVEEDEGEGGYNVKVTKEGLSPHYFEHFDTLEEAIASLSQQQQQTMAWQPVRSDD